MMVKNQHASITTCLCIFTILFVFSFNSTSYHCTGQEINKTLEFIIEKGETKESTISIYNPKSYDINGHLQSSDYESPYPTPKIHFPDCYNVSIPSNSSIVVPIKVSSTIDTPCGQYQFDISLNYEEFINYSHTSHVIYPSTIEVQVIDVQKKDDSMHAGWILIPVCVSILLLGFICLFYYNMKKGDRIEGVDNSNSRASPQEKKR